MKTSVWLVLPLVCLVARASDVSLEVRRGTNGTFELRFEPQSTRYAVEFCTNLENPQWRELTGATLRTEGNMRVVSDLHPLVVQKFYRGNFKSTSQLTQPNGAAIPTPIGCYAGQPVGLQVVLTNQCINGNCEATLWHIFNDNVCIPSGQAGLNAYTDAFQQQAYMPTGPITIRLASRGLTMFRNALGWYNVTGVQPGLADIHTVVDAAAVPGAEIVLNIASEPGYLGGAIGFVLITPESHTSRGQCAGGDCSASLARVSGGDGYCYYTDPAFNPDYVGNASYIHCLTYQSTIAYNRFYLAWDDVFSGGDNNFTDLVVAIDGITEAGP